MLDRQTLEQQQAALDRLKAEMRRRLAAKIAAGKAVRIKLAVAVEGEAPADYIQKREAAELAKLRAAGEKREVEFCYTEVDDNGDPVDARGEPTEPVALIVTGVQRPEQTWHSEPRAAPDPATPVPQPAIGDIEEGYRYNGGDPNRPESWGRA